MYIGLTISQSLNIFVLLFAVIASAARQSSLLNNQLNFIAKSKKEKPGLLHFIRNNENLTGDARGGAPAEPNKVSEEGANRTAGPGRREF